MALPRAPAPLAVLACLFLACCVHPLDARDLARHLQAGREQTLGQQLLTQYLSNDELSQWMDEFVGRCGSIARKFTIGTSGLGVPLLVLEISNNPGATNEPKPNFQYIANMHGDETSGRMLLPQLAEWLCKNHMAANGDNRASRIVNNMHLFLMPTMNPDGFAARQRWNSQAKDLNREFPDVVALCSNSLDSCVPSKLRTKTADTPPEVAAVMDWNLRGRFTAAANMHEGSVVANYPFDGYLNGDLGGDGSPSIAPDDATFQVLARAYASRNPTMSSSRDFAGGITNGAQWYPLYGGMQDWAYLAANMFELTLELSEVKSPPPAGLKKLWQQNLPALLNLPIVAAFGGASGRVQAADGSPLAATIVLTSSAGINVTSAASALGYWNRPLPPGSHSLMAVAQGYQPSSVTLTVPASGAGVRYTFKLTPQR